MRLKRSCIAAAACLVASSAWAGDIGCDEVEASENSDTPTRMTFINESGETRYVVWMNFDGGQQEYAALEDGEEFTVDTYLTHPWIIQNNHGDCVEVFMPRRRPRTVELD
jgi:hypothetical protein